MEIIHNAKGRKQFGGLCMGEVFIALDDKKVYMRTSEAYEYPDNRDHYFNAVNLEDGSLVKFNDWEEIFIPKEVFLTINE